MVLTVPIGLQETAQTLVQVRCERLHVMLLYRFLADLLHLHGSITSLDEGGEAMAAPGAAALGSVAASAARAAAAEQPDGRSSLRPVPGDSHDAAQKLPCLVEVACTDLRLDVPRCSGSSEFLSVACASVTAVAPAAAEYAESLMPSMDRCVRFCLQLF